LIFLIRTISPLSSIEKETQDSPKLLSIPSQPGSTSNIGDANAKLNQLKDLFTNFRDTVPKISGISTSKEEQLHVLASLRQQLVMKRELLLKYKNNCIFENLRQQQIENQQQPTTPLQSSNPSNSSLITFESIQMKSAQ